MANSNYYSSHNYNNLEIAICLEDTTSDVGKFCIPALTPFVDMDNPYDKIDSPASTANILSGTKGMDISPCTVSNYIDIDLPEYIKSAKKGDKFILSFIGGDINKPYLLGRYKNEK